MKIIQVVHSFYPSIGGIERHVYHLCRELIRRGHEVIVYTTGKGEEKINGVIVRRFGALSLPFFSSVNFSPGLVLAILRERADIFASHGYGSTAPFFTAGVAWLKRKPFVFTLHGYPKLRGVGGFLQFLYRWFCASGFLRIARKIIIVSRATKSEMAKEAGADKIVCIPNGVSGEFFNVKKGKTSAIAYIGRLDRYKRIGMLIGAFAELKKEFPELTLSIVGKDEGIKEELERQIRDLRIRDVAFKEAAPDGMPSVYGRIKAVVLPSAYEGFSLVWLEAMASRTAMFSTPAGEAKRLFREVYGSEAEKFLFVNAWELAARLRSFIKNERAYAKVLMAAEGKVKKHYSWEAVGERTVKIYLELLNKQ